VTTPWSSRLLSDFGRAFRELPLASQVHSILFFPLSEYFPPGLKERFRLPRSLDRLMSSRLSLGFLAWPLFQLWCLGLRVDLPSFSRLDLQGMLLASPYLVRVSYILLNPFSGHSSAHFFFFHWRPLIRPEGSIFGGCFMVGVTLLSPDLPWSRNPAVGQTPLLTHGQISSPSTCVHFPDLPLFSQELTFNTRLLLIFMRKSDHIPPVLSSVEPVSQIVSSRRVVQLA